MKNIESTPIAYARRGLPPSAATAWVLAAASLLSPFFGLLAIQVLAYLIHLRTSRDIFHVLLGSFVAGCLSSIVCGVVGLRAALRRAEKPAAWAAGVGLIFGMVMLGILAVWFVTRFV